MNGEFNEKRTNETTAGGVRTLEDRKNTRTCKAIWVLRVVAELLTRPVAESGPMGDPLPSHPKPHRKLEFTLRTKTGSKIRNIKHTQNQQGRKGPVGEPRNRQWG